MQAANMQFDQPAASSRTKKVISFRSSPLRSDLAILLDRESIPAQCRFKAFHHQDTLAR